MSTVTKPLNEQDKAEITRRVVPFSLNGNMKVIRKYYPEYFLDDGEGKVLVPTTEQHKTLMKFLVEHYGWTQDNLGSEKLHHRLIELAERFILLIDDLHRSGCTLGELFDVVPRLMELYKREPSEYPLFKLMNEQEPEVK